MNLAVTIASIVTASSAFGTLVWTIWLSLRDRGPGGKHRRR